jgi:exopolysaccharide biosynthesis protein
MKKFILFLCLSFSLITVSKAQVSFDTVLTTKVGSGITYMKILAPAIPWNINVLKVDLKNPYNKVETVKAGDHLIGQETVSSMAKRNNYDGHAVIGAVNGDFFEIGPGIPVGTQVKEGQIIHTSSNWQAVGFNVNNMPMINNVSYNGKLIAGDSSYSIANVDAGRNTNQLILYNKYFGDTTGTNAFGTEISVMPVSPWLVNDTVKCIVINKEVNTGNMIITDSTAVLSGHGTAASFLNNLKAGDTVKVINNIIPGILKLNEMIGGNLKIVNNGKLYVNDASREPRTAIGFTKDSTIMYLVTVDGRTANSLGMTFTELSNFMIKLGVYQGMNLDGGGSTTMIVRDSVVNYPSSGGIEREDANGLLVVSSQPSAGSLQSIQISPNFYRIFHGETLQFSAQGRDNLFNVINIDNSNVTYSVSGSIGSISSSGLFTAGAEADTGYVIANYNGLKDSCLIVVKSITKLDIFPKSLITDSHRVQNFQIRAFDVEGIKYNIPLTSYNWTSTDTTIGVIDSSGNFTGKKAGVTDVVVSYKGVSDTSVVNVVIEQGGLVIDSMENTGHWKFSGDNLDSTGNGISVSTDQLTQGNGSLRIDYNFTYNTNKLNYIYLDTDIPLKGVPDSMMIDVKSDGNQHQIYYMLSNPDGALFKMFTNKYATRSDGFDTLYASFSKTYEATMGATFYFPASLKQIVIKLGSTRQADQTYSGSIYLDNLRITYPGAVAGVEATKFQPDNYSLTQNYPNPFNPTTTINYSIPKTSLVTIRVYDILGREVETLVNEEKMAGSYRVMFNAASLASGIYFYRMQAGSFVSAKKLILLK